jgi:hypothetical protein
MDKTNERKKMNWRGSLWELYYDFSYGMEKTRDVLKQGEEENG